jgi:hypothetical protein
MHRLTVRADFLDRRATSRPASRGSCASGASRRERPLGWRPGTRRLAAPWCPTHASPWTAGSKGYAQSARGAETPPRSQTESERALARAARSRAAGRHPGQAGPQWRDRRVVSASPGELAKCRYQLRRNSPALEGGVSGAWGGCRWPRRWRAGPRRARTRVHGRLVSGSQGRVVVCGSVGSSGYAGGTPEEAEMAAADLIGLGFVRHPAHELVFDPWVP